MLELRHKTHKKRLSLQQQKRAQQAPNTALQTSAVILAQRNKNLLLLIHDQEVIATRRTNLPELVVGDRVLCVQKHTRWWIVARLPRHNAFTGITRGNIIRSIAANIDVLVFVCAPLPAFDIALLEQTLLSAYHARIPTIIVCNKRDLLPTVNTDDLQAVLALHAAYQRTVIYTSQDDYHTLATLLSAKRYLLFGQSGVGKSSLLNRLLPDYEFKTKPISERTQLGQHTTSVARLYVTAHFSVIDCPGVRTMIPEAITRAAINSLYPDISRLAQKCLFRNCTHAAHETRCAVQAVRQRAPSIQLDRFIALHAMLTQ